MCNYETYDTDSSRKYNWRAFILKADYVSTLTVSKPAPLHLVALAIC